MSAFDDVSGLGAILGVWAHPDDEAYLSAGLMARATDRGQRVVVVTATDGELGTDDPDDWPPARLASVRRIEAAGALSVLGVTDHRRLGLPDGSLADLPVGEHVSRLRDIIDQVAPDTIVTFGPDGMTGHPDHRTISNWVTEAVAPFAGRIRVLHAALEDRYCERFQELHDRYAVFMDPALPVSHPRRELAVHLQLSGPELDRKLDALRAHATQTLPLIDTLGVETYADWVADEAFVDAPCPDTFVSPRMVAEHDVTVNGLRLHVREVGDRKDPPLVVLHGIVSHRRDWDVLVDDLAEDHHVIAPDLRGHGLSSWSTTYSVAAMADDVADLLAQLDVERATVVGHSLGGMVAMVLAAAHRQLVGRLVVIDIAPDSLASDFAAGLAELLDVMAESSYGSVDEATDDWLTDAPLARRVLLRNFVAHALVPGDDDRLHWRFDAAGLRDFAATGVVEEELWRALDEVSCPSLLIRGEHSPLLSATAAAEAVRRSAGWELVTISGGGHDLGVERPEAVAAALRTFIADREA